VICPSAPGRSSSRPPLCPPAGLGDGSTLPPGPALEPAAIAGRSKPGPG
jgi:hypothetical protein